MRALPLHQPFASLVAVGAKRIETRGRPAPKTIVGERIAIYATKTVPPNFEELCKRFPFRLGLTRAGYRTTRELPRGAIVCTVVVHRSEEMTHRSIVELRQKRGLELDYGLYEPGRHAWHLEDVQRIHPPVPMTTRSQGIFFWTPPPDFGVPGPRPLALP